MKQKKLFCQLIWCLCINAGVLAQNIEQIHMKNGSVVEGYICEQIPGKSITIQSAAATIVVGQIVCKVQLKGWSILIVCHLCGRIGQKIS